MENPSLSSFEDFPQGSEDTYASVVHVSNEIHHHVHTHFHVTVYHDLQGCTATLSDKPSFRVFTKAGPKYSLTIRNGEVILAPSDPNDGYHVHVSPLQIHLPQNL